MFGALRVEQGYLIILNMSGLPLVAGGATLDIGRGTQCTPSSSVVDSLWWWHTYRHS